MADVFVPRHAAILPSFAVGFIKRRLRCSSGSIEGSELLAWPTTLPSSIRAQEIRSRFVASRRNHFDVLWRHPIGVRLPLEWEDLTDSIERKRVRDLLTTLGNLGQFETLTLRQVKEALHLPVVDVLGLLARFEASYWSPVLNRSSETGRLRANEQGTTREITDDWRTSVKIALRSNWIAQLDSRDIRFEHVEELPLLEWVGEQIEKDRLSDSTIALCDELVAADKCDWRTELKALAGYALRHSDRRPGTAKAHERWCAIFLSRFGGPAGKTLQEVGDEFGLTRERVRQVCDAVIQGLKIRPVQMPALDKVFGAAIRISPLTLEEADKQLCNLLGDDAGLAAAIAFAEALGRTTLPRSALTATKTARDQDPVYILQKNDVEAGWVRKAISFAKGECRAVGCTNHMRVAGYLCLYEGLSIDAEELLALFNGLPGYRLLDKQGGWFTLSGGVDSSIEKRLRKLLAVATQSVGIDEFLSAVVTDDRMFYELGRGVCAPPVHVLSALVADWSWLHADGHNKYRSREVIAPETVLSKLEQTAVAVLDGYDGVATRTDLAKIAVGQRGYSDMALSSALATSPIFCKVEHSIYRIGGRPLSINGLVEARKRRFTESNSIEPIAISDLRDPIQVVLRQSGSVVSASRRVIYLPSAYQQVLSGDFSHARGLWPKITIRPNLQITGLSGIAEGQGVKPKEAFDVVFDLSNATYDLFKYEGDGEAAVKSI